MVLKGSCSCGAVSFELQSRHPYPFNLCYCSICRKTAGGGGYAINLSGSHESLRVAGEEHVATYHASINGEQSPAARQFCQHCGSALWLYDPRWPELVHPFASAIDSELPRPPQHTHMMLASKASWVSPAIAPEDIRCEEYPEESIADWHQRHNLAAD